MYDQRPIFTDLDGVLYDFIGGLLTHLNHKFGTVFQRSDVSDYNLVRLTDDKEIKLAIVNFIKTPRTYLELAPIADAREALEMMSELGPILALTARPYDVPGIAKATRHAISRDFPQIKDTFFTRYKARIAKAERARFVIEDNPTTAREIADKRIKCWLLQTDYMGTKPRSRFVQVATSMKDVAVRSCLIQRLSEV